MSGQRHAAGGLSAMHGGLHVMRDGGDVFPVHARVLGSSLRVLMVPLTWEPG